MENFEAWRAAVVAEVRFRPDREAIAKELTAHYEDHVRDLERLDYPTELAEKWAVEAMGDPETIGKALDRVHKPWLGWLWIVSRVAVTAGGSVDRCGYHISVPYAALWEHENDGPYYAASILLTVEDNRFWDDGPAPALRQMSAMDNEAGQYTSSMEYFDYTVEERRARWGGYIQIGPQEKTPFYETYWVTIYFQNGFHPQWMELTCESGEGFTFRLEWEKGK